MLSPKISTTASFIPQFPLHLGRRFRVAAVNSSFTPANRILLESPVVGLFLAVCIQHSPVVISLRKRGRIEKGTHTATGISISIHGIQAPGAELALPQPQGLWGHPHEPDLGSQSQGSAPGHSAFKNENLSPVR